MRLKAKVDANQKQIVTALRQAGCSVQSLAATGRGVPDLLVGRDGKNLLLEIKDGSKRPSERKLTPDQENWHSAWRGQIHVVNNPDEALELVINGESLKHTLQAKHYFVFQNSYRAAVPRKLQGLLLKTN